MKISNAYNINEDLSMQGQNHERESMDITTAHALLREQGYEIVCRFGHIHAAKYGGEWHICLVDELSSMCPSRFLALLVEAITLSLKSE